MSDCVDLPGVFGRSLEATSAANRFRNPSLPPGECAGRVEEQALGLDLILQSTLCASFVRARVTDSERETVIAKVVAWSCEPRTDLAGLQAEVDAMLTSFEVAEEDRLQIIADIVRVLSGNQSRHAA